MDAALPYTPSAAHVRSRHDGDACAMELTPTLSVSDAQLRRRYLALLQGGPVIDDKNRVIESRYDRWRELKRMVIVYGLPRDDGELPGADGAEPESPDQQDDEPCSLRGRVWKVFLGVEDSDIDREKYRQLVERGASHYDGDIRNDTFRTFRGDAKFAQRVPEQKLVRLLNAFFNELGATSSEAGQNSEFPDYIRYVQGMNVLCAPLLFALPEEDAYHTFCQLILKHCPKYMAPKLRGVEHGCILVDKCLEVIDPELYRHLSSRGITARIYALPLILSLFACVPPLQELLRVWDVLFAVGVHFVVVLAVAHTVLLREQLLKKDMDLMKILSSRFAPPLQSDQLVSVALQLLHRIPDDLLFEIARHPLEDPDLPTSLAFSPETIDEIKKSARKPAASPRTTAASPKRTQPKQPPPVPVLMKSYSTGPDITRKDRPNTPSHSSAASSSAHPTFFGIRPPWRF